ncbi:MAG: DPP IV N-terminal domain-containing protein, partial [Halobacteriaceae archaeon]
MVTYRLDQRSANKFALVQSSPDDQFRPKHFTYSYPLPGEVGVPMAEPVVFDIENRRKTVIDVEPIPLLYFGSGPHFDWYDDSERLYYVHRSRGHDSAKFVEVNATTGESRIILSEESDTLVDPHMSGAHVVNGGEELIWSSERSGWHHLYLIDGDSGEVEHQITEGEWVVREVEQIDEESREIYFTASGREADRDPYLRHLYKINFDGTGLTLLTPEPYEHSIYISPSGEYFIDRYSRV